MLMLMLMLMLVSVPVMMVPVPAMVRPAQRLKGGDNLIDPCPQPLEHGLDDMVAQDHDPPFFQLRRQVTVAKVPGKLRKMLAIARHDLVKLLVGGNDFGHSPVFEHKDVTMGKGDRLGQVNENLFAVAQGQNLAPQMPLIMSKDDAVERCAMIVPGVVVIGHPFHCKWSSSLKSSFMHKKKSSGGALPVNWLSRVCTCPRWCVW
ncbi:hypothetical protein SAMN04515648_0687 [Phyllobacterium sp. CL33Tsu]|nr:hypothetical protein SAMN04515648_0687 [Phyllobacterium sp. CL33Tsu]